MLGWQNNRNLCLATMLDPRYKLAFFDQVDRQMYRSWFEEECLKLSAQTEESESRVIEQSFSDGELVFLLEGFLQDRNTQPVEVPMQGDERRSKTMVEVAEYLAEPVQSSSLDALVYWRRNANKWPALTTLVRKYLSAPPGSQESERFFSTAGFIVNDLRKRLSPNNLKMLLLLHHNLSAYNFEY